MFLEESSPCPGFCHLGFGLTFYNSVLRAAAYRGTMRYQFFVSGYFSMSLRRETFRVECAADISNFLMKNTIYKHIIHVEDR